MVDSVPRPRALYRFHLTLDDALAGERLHGDWTAWRMTTVIAAAVGVGAGSAMLEQRLGVPWWILAGGLSLFAVAVLSGWDRWGTWRRAATKAGGEWEVEEWDDHLTVRSPSGEFRLAGEMIGDVAASTDHVFVLYEEGMLILPRRAFADGAAMAAFVEAVDAQSRDAAA